MKKFVLVFVFVVMVFAYAILVNKDLSDNVVRLHVVANSNGKYDQELKLKVRDAVIKKASEISDKADSKQEAARSIVENSDKIEAAAEEVVRENGYEYDVNVEYGNFYFPEKKYDNLVLPSGRYDAVRVNIGKAEGENWWCVMFPPLCVSEDATGELDEKALAYLKSKLSEDEYEMITEDDNDAVVVRFRIVDAVMQLVEKFR